MPHEYKRCEFKADHYDDEQGIFEGYASVFGNIDSGEDIVEPGAFTDTLLTDFHRMKILSGHNSDQLPIGKPLEMHEDARGLYIKAQISDTHMGRDVKTLLRDGVLNELSIGFDADPSDCRVDEFGVRHLYKLKLWEVSVVTWAMNSSAVITDYKAQAPEAIVKQVDPLPAIQPSAPPPSRAAYKRVAKMYTRYKAQSSNTITITSNCKKKVRSINY